MSSIRLLLLKAALPLTKAMNKIHIAASHRQIKAEHYRKALEILQPGDILVTWRWGEFSNLFIPGNWSHAALYAGYEKVREATYEGVHDSDLIDFFLEKDKIAIVRPKLPASIRADAVMASKVCLGKPYDFLFSGGDASFYCSELIYWAYNASCQLNKQTFDMQLKEIMGVTTALPGDFMTADSMSVAFQFP